MVGSGEIQIQGAGRSADQCRFEIVLSAGGEPVRRKLVIFGGSRR